MIPTEEEAAADVAAADLVEVLRLTSTLKPSAPAEAIGDSAVGRDPVHPQAPDEAVEVLLRIRQEGEEARLGDLGPTAEGEVPPDQGVLLPWVALHVEEIATVLLPEKAKKAFLDILVTVIAAEDRLETEIARKVGDT